MSINRWVDKDNIVKYDITLTKKTSLLCMANIMESREHCPSFIRNRQISYDLTSYRTQTTSYWIKGK